MRTRRSDREVPGAAEPWSEIVPGLWMGGHHWTDPAGEPRSAVVDGEFDLVVSLVQADGHGPSTGVEHLVEVIPDGPLGPEQIEAVERAARYVSEAVRDGRSTLVRCHAGYNRSGLVTAQALIEQGHDVHTAINLIRVHRSPWALNNDVFVQYLTTGLDVAYLLSGLQQPG